MKSMLVSMVVVPMFCASPASSAEFPKTGEAEYDTYYVGNPVAKIDSGVGTGAIVDETGINRECQRRRPVPRHVCSLPVPHEFGGRDIAPQRQLR
jgi:hypothetical protein